MRSLRVLRIIGIGLAFAAVLATGGLPVGSQTGQGELPPFILATNYADNSVSFIDLRAQQVVTNIRVCQGPIGVDIHPARLHAYVVCWDAGALSVIRTDLRRVVGTFQLGGNLYSIAFRPDGAIAYVVDGGRNQVVVLDARNPERPQTLTRISPIGSKALRNQDFSSDGLQAYVSDSESGNVYVIDAVNHRLQQTLQTSGRCGVGIRVSHNGNWVYLADRCLATVYAIERATGRITPIPLPGAPGAWHIAFSLDDVFAYVTRTEPRQSISDGKVSVIDTVAQREVRTIEVGRFPASIQVFRREIPEGWVQFLAISDPTRSVLIVPVGEIGFPIVLIPTPGKTTISGISCDQFFCQDQLSGARGQVSGSVGNTVIVTDPNRSPQDSTYVDVNNDGKPDIIIVGTSGTGGVSGSTGDMVIVTDPNITPENSTFVDVDKDNKPDIIILGTQLR